jgi:Flp pilus assembly protein TadD
VEGTIMYRIALRVAAVALALMAVMPAFADDRSKCDNDSGDEAIAACSRLIAKNPRDSKAFNNRGIEYRKKGDVDRAIADYDQAIRLEPS